MTRYLFLACAATFASLVPTGFGALPDNGPVAVDAVGSVDPLRAKALDLAQRQYSRQRLDNQVSQTLEKSLPDSLRKSPQFIDLERAYPGLIEVIVVAIKPPMLKAYADKAPLLWSRLADHYAATFTSADFDKIFAFLDSPAGIRLRESIASNSTNSATLDAAVKNGPDDMGSMAAASRTDQAKTLRNINSKMSADDRVAIFKFENSPVGVKMAALAPKLQQTMLEWDFYFTDEQKASFNEVRSAAVTDFMARMDAEKESASKSGQN
jgi:hypothetical protein